MLQVLEQGRTGETEPIFTALIAASLLSWHGLWTMAERATESRRETMRVLAWTLGGTCAGLAMLTKGLQAPLYFFGSLWTYLLLTRQWRTLFSRAHLAGGAAFLLVVGTWQWAFVERMGWDNGLLIYTSNVAKRFHDDRLSTILSHLLTYPVAVVAGCLAPWSVLFLALADRRVRNRLAGLQVPLIFSGVCVAVCFPSVWLPPEARPRYFMPLFPCFAVMLGCLTQVLAELAGERPHRLWTAFVQGGCLLMLASALAVLTLSLGWPDRPVAPPLLEAVVYGAVASGLAVWTWRFALRPSAGAMQRASLSIAVFLAATYTGPVLTTQAQRSEDLPAAIVRLHRQLPPDCRLVSLDHVHHVFLYEFGRTVERQPIPQTAADVPAELQYFCIQTPGNVRPDLPFPWTEVASVSVDRNRHPTPQERIIVGRRDPALTAAPDDTGLH
jgi:4-amino-4-deoxy-L-arabinose transferase-like glycosyltransferase